MAGTVQKVILALAAIGLIISLIVVGIMIQKQNKSNWPPMVPACPDWWKATEGSDGKIMCTNVQNLGKCPGPLNPSDPMFTGADGMCNKYKWASNCGVQWDGITYGVDNPCDASSSSAPA
jgi:hypothetical protein